MQGELDGWLALNEVVIDRGTSTYLGMLDIYCDGTKVTTAQADGLIIATPTGGRLRWGPTRMGPHADGTPRGRTPHVVAPQPGGTPPPTAPL